MVAARQLHGKELSYNNLLDLDSALAIVREFARPGRRGHQAQQSLRRGRGRHAGRGPAAGHGRRSASAFGSVLGLNRPVDAATAEVLAAPGLFVEAIVAPDFEPEALEILTTQPKWKANVRLMEVGPIARPTARWTYRGLDGGLLVQEADVLRRSRERVEGGDRRQPAAGQMADLRFAWAMVRHVKSNAIVLAKDRMLLGTGAGQMSRVDSVEIAVKKAGERAARLGAGLRRLLPLPRFDRRRGRGRRDGRHPARRLAQRRRRDRRLQPPRPADDLHRPAAFQALGMYPRHSVCRYGTRSSFAGQDQSAKLDAQRPKRRVPGRRELREALRRGARRSAISSPPSPAGADPPDRRSEEGQPVARASSAPISIRSRSPGSTSSTGRRASAC